MVSTSKARGFTLSWQLLAIASVVGCGGGGTSDAGTGPTQSTSGSTAGTSTGSEPTSSGPSGSTGSTTAGSWMPVACEGLTSPFLSAECLTGLRDACRTIADEAECGAEEPLRFGGGGYIIHCAWAKVVTFAEVATCEVAAVSGRCEAGIEDTTLGCGNRCSMQNSLQFSLRAAVDEMALIELGCAANGNYVDGPLGPQSAVGAEPGEFGSACIESTKPPAPPICDCEAAACAAE